MRPLSAAQNVDGSTADYPKGKVRDKAGATAGTTTNEVLFGDFIQFFQKLVIDAGITENGNPDNVSNGYQLIEALVSKIRDKAGFRDTLNINSTGTFTPSATEDVIIINTSGADVLLNMPDPALHKNRIMHINYDGAAGDNGIGLLFSTGSWGIVPGGFNAFYNADVVPTFMTDLGSITSFRSLTIKSDGNNWTVLNAIRNAIG